MGRVFLQANSSLNREEFFCLEKISGGLMMIKLEQLYEERNRLNTREVTGFAGAMQRHRKREKIQEEINYYELGDNISRKHIQKELAEIETIQGEVNRLTAVVEERRRKLMVNVFGANTVI